MFLCAKVRISERNTKGKLFFLFNFASTTNLSYSLVQTLWNYFTINKQIPLFIKKSVPKHALSLFFDALSPSAINLAPWL